MANEEGTTWIQISFSVISIQQYKEKLCKFSEDSEKFADGILHPTNDFSSDLVRYLGEGELILVSFWAKVKRKRVVRASSHTNGVIFAALPTNNQQPTDALFGSQEWDK